MAKIKAPLFSIDASGTLDKSITYKNKPQTKTASKYSKPGSVNPFESSPRQKDQRTIIGLITAAWQSKTSLDQLAWNNAAKDARFKGSGYHYFLHLAQSDLTTYLGLVGFWSMNYNIGDKIPDLSGNNNHGTLSPIYPCDCPQPVDSNNKKNGKAYYFNGTTSYINLGNSTSLFPTKEISLGISFKVGTTINVSIFGLDSSHKFFGLHGPYNIFGFFSTTDLDTSYEFATGVDYDDNLYHHVFYTYNYIDGYLKVYFDGFFLNQKYFGGLMISNLTYNACINGRNGGTSILCPGSFDNPTLYNRQLPLTEIQSLYRLFI